MKVVPAVLNALQSTLVFTSVVTIFAAGTALIGHVLVADDGYGARTTFMLVAVLVLGIGMLLVSSTPQLRWQRIIGAGLLSVGVLAFMLVRA